MTWLIWRQHRAEAGIALLLIGCLGIAFYTFGHPMHVSFVRDGVAACTAQPRDACIPAIEQFRNTFGNVRTMLLMLNLVPAAIGAFLGAPLIAREFEAGTWQLAWTQAVPRPRWLAMKLTALGTATMVLAIAFAALATWYRQPWDALDGRFAPEGFDLEGLMPAVYALFAFAAGTTAGALVKRSVPALAVALAAFAAVRYTIDTHLRPHFGKPVTTVWDPITQRGAIDRNGWSLASGIVDAQGHHLTMAQAYQTVYKAATVDRTDVPTYLHTHGMRLWDTYQPGSRFWTFQLKEAAIYLGLIAILLAVVTWRIGRRTV